MLRRFKHEGQICVHLIIFATNGVCFNETEVKAKPIPLLNKTNPFTNRFIVIFTASVETFSSSIYCERFRKLTFWKPLAVRLPLNFECYFLLFEKIFNILLEASDILFRTSGDIFPGFQNLDGSFHSGTLSHECNGVPHSLTSWWPAWQTNPFPTYFSQAEKWIQH